MPLSNVRPEQYQVLLAEKAAKIRDQFEQFNIPQLEVFASRESHFRMRAEFRVWHDDEHCFFAMFKKDDPKTPCKIDDFPIGSQHINTLMRELLVEINASETLKTRLFQIEFLTSLSGQALVTMIYHRPLDEIWHSAGLALQEKYAIDIIGRSKKQRRVLGRDHVIETLQINEQSYSFQQVENSFTQPNARVNQYMVGWALEHSKDNGNDLLELYCGNGNFTAVLAQNFDKVLCTEISKTSVKSAEYNFSLNKVDNVKVVRMSSEEFTSALNGEREYRRLRGIDLSHYNFSTIFVDPPRAGLDPETEKLVSRFDNIIYISCNPDTLQHNLGSICRSHKIDKMALFDQFPYTDHIECGAVLSRR